MKFRGTTTTGKQFVADTMSECVKGIAETAGVESDPVVYNYGVSAGTYLLYANHNRLRADDWFAKIAEEES